MARNTANSQFNRTVHEEDVDSEKSADLEHAALSKILAGTPSVPSVSSTPPVAQLTPPAPAAAPVPAFHQHFPHLMAAMKPAVPAATVKIAPAAPRKPFQRRI